MPSILYPVNESFAPDSFLKTDHEIASDLSSRIVSPPLVQDASLASFFAPMMNEDYPLNDAERIIRSGHPLRMEENY